VFFNKYEDFKKEELDESKLLIPYEIIKSSDLC